MPSLDGQAQSPTVVGELSCPDTLSREDRRRHRASPASPESTDTAQLRSWAPAGRTVRETGPLRPAAFLGHKHRSTVQSRTRQAKVTWPNPICQRYRPPSRRPLCPERSPDGSPAHRATALPLLPGPCFLQPADPRHACVETRAGARRSIPAGQLRPSPGGLCQQPQAPPQQPPPPPAGTDGALPPRPVTATVERSLTVSMCPCGQLAGAEASAIGRFSSKVSPQARQRKSYRGIGTAYWLDRASRCIAGAWLWTTDRPGSMSPGGGPRPVVFCGW